MALKYAKSSTENSNKSVSVATIDVKFIASYSDLESRIMPLGHVSTDALSILKLPLLIVYKQYEAFELKLISNKRTDKIFIKQPLLFR